MSKITDNLTTYRKEALVCKLTSIDEEIGTLNNRQQEIQELLNSATIDKEQRKALVSEQRRNNAHINTYKAERNELENELKKL